MYRNLVNSNYHILRVSVVSLFLLLHITVHCQVIHCLGPVVQTPFCVGQTVIVQNWDSSNLEEFCPSYNNPLDSGNKVLFFFPDSATSTYIPTYPNCPMYRDTIMRLPFAISFNDTGSYAFGEILFNPYDSFFQEGIVDFFFQVIYCPPISYFKQSVPSICAGDCVQYTDSSGGYPMGWIWYFQGGDIDSFMGQHPPPICYADTGTYTTTLIGIGRYSSDTSYQTVSVHSCGSCLYVPNAFTPNGDGINDTFRVYTACQYTYFNIRVFDRWGEKVFESGDISVGWDGKYRGVACPPGTYTYELNSSFHADGIREQTKGSITLIR